MNEKANPGRTMTRHTHNHDDLTRRPRSRNSQGGDGGFGVARLVRFDAAIEDLATRVVADEHARRFLATKREYGREGRVIFLDPQPASMVSCGPAFWLFCATRATARSWHGSAAALGLPPGDFGRFSRSTSTTQSHRSRNLPYW